MLGAGNPASFVNETADIKRQPKISFSVLALIITYCIAEKSVVAMRQIEPQLVQRNGEK